MASRPAASANTEAAERGAESIKSTYLLDPHVHLHYLASVHDDLRKVFYIPRESRD